MELKNVEAGYGGGMVLQGLSLVLDKGTITCIVGPNGAGKSTVLRVISGLLTVSSGEVLFVGQSLVKKSPSEILKLGIAQVPQNSSLFPDMTVKENVMMGGYPIRTNRRLLAERMAMVEDFMPVVKEKRGEKAGNLSGGQRRMVEISRALMLDPQLVLMDEPSLGLDPKSVAKVSAVIREMAASGRTVLLVEQNVRLGMNLATHGVVMEQGKDRISGDAAGIADNPEVASMYLGKAK
jgi:branched-chain amino acid transport system ATP-binding protein